MQDVIYVACDDSGAEAKGWILEYLDAHGYAWRDCGGDETPSRYPYYAAKVAAAVSRGEIRRGILICGSGIGMSIAANKFRMIIPPVSPGGTTIPMCCASEVGWWAGGCCCGSWRHG